MRNASSAGAFLLLFISSSFALAQPAAKPPMAAGGLQEQMRAALEQQQGRLGELQPWQKVIFDQEVLTNHQRFIKDYRPAGRGVTIDMDLATLKNYIRFHASQLSGNSAPGSATDPAIAPEQRAFALVQPQKNCEKCSASEAAVKSQLKERLERRGLKVVWVTPEELGTAPEGKALEDRVFQFMKQNAGAAAAVARLEKIIPDDVDTAHADELRFKMHVTLAVRDIARHDMDLEVLETGKFESAFARLMTDAFTEVGSRQAQLGFQQGGGTQILIEVTGFSDFASYREFVQSAQQRLGDSEPLIERKVARGSVTLALRTARKKEEIRALLAERPALGLKWEVK